MEVNVNRRATEAGWIKLLDEFWLSVTPRWFEWLNWVVIVGALSYLVDRGAGVLVRLGLGLSFVALFFYFQALFFRLRFTRLPGIRSDRLARLLSLLVSGTLAWATFMLLRGVIEALRIHPAS